MCPRSPRRGTPWAAPPDSVRQLHTRLHRSPGSLIRLRMYQVDAFTGTVFRGNPAAVVPLLAWLEATTMQAIAAENNLSETAFLLPNDGHYHLRWFTPTHEVPLCGHATLAAAFVVFTILEPTRASVTFDTLSGVLEVTREAGNGLTMDFPKHLPQPCEAPPRAARWLNPRTAGSVGHRSGPELLCGVCQ